jgi:hypothetical protein
MTDGDRRVWIGVGSVLLLIGGVAGARIYGQWRAAPAGPAGESIPTDLQLRHPALEAPPPMTFPEVSELLQCRDRLETVVQRHALDPENPWAVEHALISLGPEAVLTNGEIAVDYLFSAYAEPVTVAGQSLIRFPVTRPNPGKPDIRVEPHSDLILSGLAQLGVDPERAVNVDGKRHTVADLWRHSLSRAWIDGQELNTTWDDTPWTLIGLTAYAPPGLKWVAAGGHEMTIDRYTHSIVKQLHRETEFLREAIVQHTVVNKRKQFIFNYTCGGAHLLQGAAFAVARGFGEPGDRHFIEDEVPALFFRYGVEMKAVDDAMAANPEYRVVLLSQRLKFLGHFLESAQRLSAMGFYRPDSQQAETLKSAMAETCATTTVLDKAGVLDHLPEIRAKNEQLYLDLVGDSAHALRGMDYMLGRRKVIY